MRKKNTVKADIKRVFKAVVNKIWLICMVTVLCAVAVLLGTYFLITPQYQSSAMFYVNNSTLMGESTFSITSGDITASKSLVDTYMVILKSRACLTDVLDYAESGLSYDELKGMITAESVNSTEIFQVTVTSTDPEEAEILANSIAYILPKRISSIVEGTAANIVDYAIVPTKQSSPNYMHSTVFGLILGFLLSLTIVVVRELFDTTIRSQEDVEQSTQYPVLASVPDMNLHNKTGYYSYGSYQSGKRQNSATRAETVGKNISFAASEAYKLLRTKLEFSFVEEIACPIIGVSSAMAGEGKSLTSINLANSLSQLNKRVLLIDCDLRRPSVEVKLHINKTPGLSNYLTSQLDLYEVIQHFSQEDEKGFDVIASGNNPPNPIELINSSKMERALNSLKEEYDYIILDLPPVGEVSDALVASKLVNGILIVVRQDYCSMPALMGAIEQFEFVESKILGIVMNYAGEENSKYGKKYYRKYYSSYQSGYLNQ